MGVLIADRVRQLQAEGKKGVEIAKVLYKEKYGLAETSDTFLTRGYAVHIEEVRSLEMTILHVSNSPLEGIAVIFAMREPLALPSFVWR